VAGRAGDDGLRVIVASTAERVLDLPTGAPDASWSRLVTASAKGATTVVQELVVDSLERASETIDGAWRLPTIGADPTPVGVSIDGETIVLVEDSAASASPAETTSRVAILRRSLAAAPRIVTLAGSFEYDTLSPDGSTLYVVEHLAGPPDGHYQVRAVDTASGALRDAVVADKTGGDEAMAGWPIAQVRRPDGMVFTLYRGPEHPFIHALSSIDAWALCIDLPATGADDTAAELDWVLAATTGGSSLIAANATIGVAVEIPFGDLAVRRSVTFSPSASTVISLAKFGHEPGGPVGRRLVASPLGSTLYAAGAGGIVSLGATDLAVTGRFLEGVSIDAMAVTPDGTAIYALVHSDGRIVKLDAVTGKIVGQVPVGGFDRLVAIVPW
jgi:DNA-binding beta-propeller fold protein YncE